jgi:hypothetical protein
MNAIQLRELGWFSNNTNGFDFEKILRAYNFPEYLIEHLKEKYFGTHNQNILNFFLNLDCVNSEVFADILTKASNNHRFFDSYPDLDKNWIAIDEKLKKKNDTK